MHRAPLKLQKDVATLEYRVIWNYPQQLLHEFLQERPVEIIANGIINESLLCLRLAASLIPEHYVIIPTSFNPRRTSCSIHIDQRISF